MYRQFNIQQFYVLPKQCIYIFVWIWGQTATILLYSINCLDFMTDIYPFNTQFLIYVPPV